MVALVKTIMKKAFLTLMVALLFLPACIPSPVFAEANPFKLTVKQVFCASSVPSGATFEYKLKPLENGAPMPSGCANEEYGFTITGNSSKEIGPFSNMRPGAYHYRLSQVTDTQQPGFIFDKQTYLIEALVDEDLDVDLIVNNEDGTKADSISFEIALDELLVDPPVRKIVRGNPSRDSVFTFTLTALDDPLPMPPGSVNGVKTIQIVGSGEEDFGMLSYTQPGIYRYSVKEVNTGENGYTYDTAVYTITDTVTETGGTLASSRVITNYSNTPVTAMVFINTYNSNAAFSATYKTGDNMPVTFYTILLALSGITILWLAVFRKKKRGESAGRE